MEMPAPLRRTASFPSRRRASSGVCNPLGPLAIVWRYLPQLTLSALTGYLVSQLVAGQRPAVDLTPLRPDRF
jgi:hypothetical protein